MQSSVLWLFLIVIKPTGVGMVLDRRQDAVELTAIAKNVYFPGRTIFVERVKIAKNLSDFVLLTGLAGRLPAALDFWSCGRRKDHAINEVCDALAIGVIEYLADHALEERLILKFNLLLSNMSRSLFGLEWSCV
jgi:hypothetical protein